MLASLGLHGAVRYLELPELYLHADYTATFKRLRQHGCLEELTTTLKQLANKQATNGLINYAQRRKKLASWTGIDPETWSALLPYARPEATHVEHLPDRAHAAVWLWCKLTGGYALAAPIALPHHDLQKHTTIITASRQSYATGC
jgi:hypothetical protein